MLDPTNTLQVEVTWVGPPSSTPDSLTGYLIFSAASVALNQAANQAAPSPFVNGTRFVCYMTQTASAVAGPGGATFTFPAIQYAGNLRGRYELTFIAESGSGDTATQWSADPEFDTSS